MNQLAFDAPETPPPEKSQTPSTLQDGLPVRRGIAIPKHIVSQGLEGYRTPTVEDYGKHHSESRLGDHRVDETSRNGSQVRLAPHNPGFFTRHPYNVRFLEHLEWRERIRHFTWTFFTMTMATGGIANVLYTVPFRFTGLEAIGIIFFILNFVLFILNIILISLRFYCHPETFKASFLHPTERLFFPAAVVSFGTILINISQYGPSHAGRWLNDAVAVLFWFDCGLAVVASMVVYLLVWSTKSFTIGQMTPVWIFPAYPMLIIGPHAAVLSQTLKPERALGVIIGGFTIQGIGFLVSMMIYSAFIYRLMTQKLPQEATRPGMFVSIGPAGFTVFGIVEMAASAERALPADFMGDGRMTAIILKVVASWVGLWIWGLALWFFFISIGAHWSCVGRDKMTFAMTWYSFVFPNTALITATFAIGRAFNSRNIQIIGCVMTPLLIVVWIWVFGMMIRAIFLKQILWPQKGEDKDEGGFKGPPDKRSLSEGRASSVNNTMKASETPV